MQQKNLILGMATTVLAIFGFLPWSEATQQQPTDVTSSTAVSSSATPATSNTSASIASAQPTTATPAAAAPQVSAPTPTSRPIATTLVHDLDGRPVVTVYLRGIPALTFLNPTPVQAANAQVATTSNIGSALPTVPTVIQTQADQFAARINQLHQSGLDANVVRVAWNPEIRSYRIYAGSDPRQDALLTLGNQVIFPQGGKNVSEDALKITNLLRRQMGNAPALSQIEGSPNHQSRGFTIATGNIATGNLGTVRSQMVGVASWYGPGFHGARTASGERFNQFDMTAAHKTLPFGTMVRVTNLNTGRSVVVRINDRGPFTPGRSIDLSRGAAEVIGLVSSGVGSVRMEVLQ